MEKNISQVKIIILEYTLPLKKQAHLIGESRGRMVKLTDFGF